MLGSKISPQKAAIRRGKERGTWQHTAQKKRELYERPEEYCSRSWTKAEGTRTEGG